MKDALNKAYDFWFGDLSSPKDYPAKKAKIWFSASQETDQYLTREFSASLEEITHLPATLHELNKKEQIGLILILDQFSRNIHRGSPKAFEKDPIARALTHALLEQGVKNFYPIEKAFLYLPLEHSEKMEDQTLCVRLYEKLVDEVSEDQKDIYREFLDFALRHERVIRRFGRYPHRNKVLGRQSTPEELEFLKEHPMGF